MSQPIILKKGSEEKAFYPEDLAAATAEGWVPREGEGVLAYDEQLGADREISVNEYLADQRRTRQDISVADPEAQTARGEWNFEEDYYGGVGMGAAALGLGAANALTLGGTNALLGTTGLAEDVQGLQEHQTGAYLAGEIGGAVLGSMAGAAKALGTAGRGANLLAKTPAGALGVASTRVGKAVGGVRGAALGEAIEGGVYAAGQAASQMVLTDRELTAETLASEIGGQGLLGAAFGGAAGGAFAAAGKVGSKIAKARRAKAEATEQFSILNAGGEAAESFRGVVRENIDNLNKIGDDFHKVAKGESTLDDATFQRYRDELLSDAVSARQANSSYIDAARKELANAGDFKAFLNTRKAIPEDIAAAHGERIAWLRELDDTIKAAEKSRVTNKIERLDKLAQGTAKEQAAFVKQSKKLADDAKRLGDLLGQSDEGIERLIGTVDERLPLLIREKASRANIAQQYPSLAEVTKAQKAVSKAFGGTDEVFKKASVGDLAAMQPKQQMNALAALNDYGRSLKAAATEVGDDTSAEVVDRLFLNMRDELAKHVDMEAVRGMDMNILLGSVGLAQATPDFEGPVDDIAKTLLAYRFLKGKSSDSGGLLSSLLGSAGARTGAQVAYKGFGGGLKGAAMAGVGAGVGRKLASGGVDAVGQGGKLAELTNKLTQQVTGLVEKLAAGTGTIAAGGAGTAQILRTLQLKDDVDRKKESRMSLKELFKERSQELSEILSNPDSHRMLNENLAPIRDVDFETGDRLEMQLMGDLQYLHDKTPRDTGNVGVLGVSSWQPTETQIMRWSNYLEAFVDPSAPIRGMLDGTITPEGAEFLRERRPRLFMKTQALIAENATAIAENSTYDQVNRISVLSGVPVNPLMKPHFRQGIQQRHQMAAEQQAQQSQQVQQSPKSTSHEDEMTGAQKQLTRG